MRFLRHTPCQHTGLPRLETPGAGIPVAKGGVGMRVEFTRSTKSTVGLEQRVKRFPLEQFVSELAVVAADVIRHTPADARLSRSRPTDRFRRALADPRATPH